MEKNLKHLMSLILILFTLTGSPAEALAEADALKIKRSNDWFSFSGNFDTGYRKTQFFRQNHDAIVGTWDGRFELWLPPFRGSFSWGPFVRIAGIVSSSNEAWENAWLASPGLGFQIYPFSFQKFQDENSTIGKFLGPLRLFAEYNWMDYWGEENDWRPDRQIRMGMEYWRNLHANDLRSDWWTEIWSGVYWQSANEFNDEYDTLNLAASIRSGLRISNLGLLSIISPYIVIESSYNNNETYYWENRLIAGGGLRIAPSLSSIPTWVSRFVLYAEYVYAAEYYHETAPSTVPDDDIRIGLSFSLGDWYH